jgi:predicted acetyltransferase
MSSAVTLYPISRLAEGEHGTFVRTVARAFGEAPDDETVAHYTDIGGPQRALVARDRGRIVGTTTSFDFRMSLPYAAPVACPGVTAVSVQPTHRRRGILSRLMRAQIDDLHANGDAWAALYASEAAIYGRFGYGVATRSLAYRLDGPWKQFAQPVEPATVDWLEVPQALERVPTIYRAVCDEVPGLNTVSDAWWRWHLGWDRESDRDGATDRQIVAIDDRAYATYRLTHSWSDTGPDSTLNVEDCMATDPAAYRQIWAYLLGIDLVQHVTAHLRPVDDPLPWWLAHRGRLRATASDPCYVRLIDVGAALSQRGTSADTDVVLELRDAFCPWNARRWRLEGDGVALRCTPADAPPDLTLDARELASLSLGGVSASELVRAALIDERRAGAARRLDALLASQRPPWNSFIF